MNFLAALETAGNSVKPGYGSPVWPEVPQVGDWLWKHAVPRFWEDVYGTSPRPEYDLAPDTWSFTAPNVEDGLATHMTTPGFHMMNRGYERVERESLEKTMFRFFCTGVQWARLVVDRSVARLDPIQTNEDDLGILAHWADADPKVLEKMDPAMRRRYILKSRHIQRVRGLDALEGPLSYVTGASFQLSFDPKRPFLRVAHINGRLTPGARILLRRSIPPHLAILIRSEGGMTSRMGMGRTFVTMNIPNQGVFGWGSRTSFPADEEII